MNNLRLPWFIHGDTLQTLKWMPDKCVQCVVTSPPYFGLRNYQVDGQIGLEATPDLYVAKLVEVFAEIWRVLRDDGVVWLNLGDSYAGSWGNQGRKEERGTQRAINGPMLQKVHDGRYKAQQSNTGKCPPGIKPKELIGIPWRVAFALSDAGWYRRSAIVWQKPNPMVESCKDRPTSAYEMVFLFTKQSEYFCDMEAIKEPAVTPAGTKGAKGSAERFNTEGVNSRPPEYANYDGWRNVRNVWTIPCRAYKGAHFATMPVELAERCIKAGTSEKGCCARCGAPWKRQTKRSVSFCSGSGKAGNIPNGKHAGSEQAMSGSYDVRMGAVVNTTTTGWSPTCTCPPAEPVPCRVLDPFSGAGTTALAAHRLGRNAVGIDLNADYCKMAEDRIAADIRKRQESVMPSESRAQHNAMTGAAHDEDLRRKLGIPKKVAEDFVHADEKDKDYKKREHVAKKAEAMAMTPIIYSAVYGEK